MQVQTAAVLCFTGGHNFKKVITTIWNRIGATIMLSRNVTLRNECSKLAEKSRQCKLGT